MYIYKCTTPYPPKYSLIFNHLSAWYIQERVTLTLNVPFPKLLHEAMQKLHTLI